jgi:hypothetical protein
MGREAMDTTTIQLDPHDVDAVGETMMTTAGVPVILSLSAFDVPRSVSVERDEARHVLRLTFQYIDHEEPVSEVVSPDLTVSLGKNSKKVLALEVKGGSAYEIRVRIVEGVEAQLRRAKKDNQRLNYKAIWNVVRGKKLESSLMAIAGGA